MAYFAKVDENNVVLEVVIVNDDIVTTEQAGIDFLKEFSFIMNPNPSLPILTPW